MLFPWSEFVIGYKIECVTTAATSVVPPAFFAIFLNAILNVFY